MMTLSKLRGLGDRTCVRKCALLFGEGALSMDAVDRRYLMQVCTLFDGPQFSRVLTPRQRDRLRLLAERFAASDGRSYRFAADDIHHFLLSVLGSEPSDWDFVDDGGTLDGSERTLLDHVLILDRIRSPFNVGSIFRTADSFGISEIWLVEGTADISHPRCVRTARGCLDTVSHRIVAEEAVAGMALERGLSIFALELGGTALPAFSFPVHGAAVIGSEELGVDPVLLALCDRSGGRVSIPLSGSKGSLNVSVATGIMLQRWFSG